MNLLAQFFFWRYAFFLWFFCLNIFYSGIEYSEKEWVWIEVWHYPIQTQTMGWNIFYSGIEYTKQGLSAARWKTTVIVVGETNSVIYKFTSIGMIWHTYCPIDIHKSSMIINQTIIELLDIRYAQNYILDEDTILFCSVYALAIFIANYMSITGLEVFTLHRHIKYNYGRTWYQIIQSWFGWLS